MPHDGQLCVSFARCLVDIEGAGSGRVMAAAICAESTKAIELEPCLCLRFDGGLKNTVSLWRLSAVGDHG